MRRYAVRRWMVLPILVALALFLTPTGASAHDRHPLAGGTYQAVVGWLTEPAYEGQMNGFDLTVTDESQKGADGKGTPVMGLEKTLFVEISTPSGAKQELALRARSGMPGKYTANVLPTTTGQYIFRIFGMIGAARVDERFDKSETVSLADVQFPPQAGVADVQAQLAAVRDEAMTARSLSIAGLVLGACGLAVGAVALMRRPTRLTTR